MNRKNFHFDCYFGKNTLNCICVQIELLIKEQKILITALYKYSLASTSR